MSITSLQANIVEIIRKNVTLNKVVILGSGS